MPDFQNGMFSCFSVPVDCLVGTFLPCVTYGETEYRLRNPADTTAAGNEVINNDCLMWYCLGYFTCGIYSCLKTGQQRTAIRNKAGIPGNDTEDYAWACCCHCCTLIQSSHEVQDMQTQKGVYGGQSQMTAEQPAQVSGMVYEKPEGQVPV